MQRSRLAASAALAGALLVTAPATAQASAPSTVTVDSGHQGGNTLTVATIDVGLSADHDGEVLASLGTGDDGTARRLAATLQAERPDVVVLTGIDVDASGAVVDTLRAKYLAVPQGSGKAIDYGYTFSPQTNSGVPSGADLDGDGTIGGPGDALGAGAFEGQNSMVVLSQSPITASSVRTFDTLLWDELPGNHLQDTGYSSLVASALPLQSTSLWDVPIRFGDKTVHVLATSATSATAGESADELRQRDQLAFLEKYAAGDQDLKSIVDDQGRPGPLAAESLTVIAGSLGADADGSGSGTSAVSRLLASNGSGNAAPSWGDHAGEPATVFGWGDPLRRLLAETARATRLGGDGAGRYDFVVPSRSLTIERSGLADAAGQGADGSSRLVWVSLSH